MARHTRGLEVCLCAPHFGIIAQPQDRSSSLASKCAPKVLVRATPRSHAAARRQGVARAYAMGRRRSGPPARTRAMQEVARAPKGTMPMCLGVDRSARLASSPCTSTWQTCPLCGVAHTWLNMSSRYSCIDPLTVYFSLRLAFYRHGVLEEAAWRRRMPLAQQEPRSPNIMGGRSIAERHADQLFSIGSVLCMACLSNEVIPGTSLVVSQQARSIGWVGVSLKVLGSGVALGHAGIRKCDGGEGAVNNMLATRQAVPRL